MHVTATTDSAPTTPRPPQVCATDRFDALEHDVLPHSGLVEPAALEKERKKERERECVCVCVCARVCLCVCAWGGEGGGLCLCAAITPLFPLREGPCEVLEVPVTLSDGRVGQIL